MCWILHGAVQGNVDENSLNAVNAAHACRMARGTKHDVKMALVFEQWDYRLTNGACDCDSAVGKHDVNAAEITDLAALIREVSALPGAVTVNFCKTWAPGRNKNESLLKLSQTDLQALLADLQPNTLYTVQCKA